MSTEQIANLFGFAATGIGIVTFVPQVWRCLKTKDTKAVSFVSFALLAVATFLWTIYGILLSAVPIIIANTVIFSLSVFLLFLKRKYG